MCKVMKKHRKCQNQDYLRNLNYCPWCVYVYIHIGILSQDPCFISAR